MAKNEMEQSLGLMQSCKPRYHEQMKAQNFRHQEQTEALPTLLQKTSNEVLLQPGSILQTSATTSASAERLIDGR